MELKIILKSKLGINIFCYENISLYFIYYIHIIYVYICIYISISVCFCHKLDKHLKIGRSLLEAER